MTAFIVALLLLAALASVVGAISTFAVGRRR